MTIQVKGYVITGTPAEVWELLQIEAPEKTPTTAAAKEPPTAPAEKKAPKNPGKQIDLGKAKALRNAGWSYDKIGEELNVSGVTISTHLKKMEAENDLNIRDMHGSGNNPAV